MRLRNIKVVFTLFLISLATLLVNLIAICSKKFIVNDVL